MGWLGCITMGIMELKDSLRIPGRFYKRGDEEDVFRAANLAYKSIADTIITLIYFIHRYVLAHVKEYFEDRLNKMGLPRDYVEDAANIKQLLRILSAY